MFSPFLKRSKNTFYVPTFYFFIILKYLALNNTPLEETECFSNPYFQLTVQVPSFLIHPLLLTQSFRTHLVPFSSLRSTCVTYGMPYHFTDHEVLPTEPRKAEDFFRGDKCPMDVFLPACLDYLQPI